MPAAVIIPNPLSHTSLFPTDLNANSMSTRFFPQNSNTFATFVKEAKENAQIAKKEAPSKTSNTLTKLNLT